MPHEMLHTFGFGHADFMMVWQHEVFRRFREPHGPTANRLPVPATQEGILTLLRQEPGNHDNYLEW